LRVVHNMAFVVVGILFASMHFLSAQPSTGSVSANTPADVRATVFPEGTWINMRFIEELKTNKSITKALAILRPDELLILRAAPQRDSSIILYTSRDLDEGVATEVVINTVKNLGDQRRINVLGQWWLLGLDKAMGEYVAIHSTVDSNAKPDVFAFIPSRNQNADFIYQRVLNSATLSGSYRDAKGRPFTFSSKQEAKTPTLGFRYRIEPAPGMSYQIIEEVSDKPKRLRYAYAWIDDELVVSTFRKNGTLKPLYKLKRNAKQHNK